ncbi:anionic trypsin-1-like [Pollicipes pollicipes]|uniref:anionic trypsin-1-like n=1 Tax=Pollicipes pollicipes TaxID=41117 RepID=UPI0018853FBB|nr:anionic trypsin-1-like [Pollicipes pollicipes]
MARKHQRSSDTDQVRVQVEKIIIHPGYNRFTQDKDLALIKLSSSLRSLINDADGRVRPVCLLSAACGGGGSCLAGQKAILAGWGVTKPGTSSTPATVQQVIVPIMTNAACAAAYAADGIGITSRMVCAGLDEGGKDTCQGDSGGPMMLKGADNVYTLAGIVSFGKGCAVPGNPGVYTRVSEFYNWIKDNSRV